MGQNTRDRRAGIDTCPQQTSDCPRCVYPCSFDYGEKSSTDNTQPDIVMTNVEYMRVRSGDPVARFMAEQVQRYEQRMVMEVRSFSFEQYEKKRP